MSYPEASKSFLTTYFNDPFYRLLIYWSVKNCYNSNELFYSKNMALDHFWSLQFSNYEQVVQEVV